MHAHEWQGRAYYMHTSLCSARFEHFAHVPSQTFTLNGASLPLFSRNASNGNDGMGTFMDMYKWSRTDRWVEQL
jgi:hypothetical protein